MMILTKKQKFLLAISDIRLTKVVSEVLTVAAVAVVVNVATGNPGITTLALLAGVIFLHVIVSAVSVLFLEHPQKHSELTNLNPITAPSRRELLEVLSQDSAIRVRERWESLQLPAEVVDRLELQVEDLVADVDIAESEVALITGELGSGKSTLAEVIHRRAITAAAADSDERWPIMLDGRSASKVDFENFVKQAIPEGCRTFSLVVDGLDEVDRDAAEGIAKSARSLAHRFPGSRTVLFSRPGFVRWRDPVAMPPLSEMQTSRILEIVADRRLFPTDFPEPLRSELHKPLFAILAARYFALDRPRSVTPAGLLAILVEDVLARESRSGVDVYQSLRKLASKTTEYGGPVPESEAGPPEVRDALTATRLIVRRNRLLSFPNPTIEQYFAAQALLRGEVPVSRQIESLSLWERWRLAWMLSVAVGSWDETLALIAPLLSVNPGTASWLIGEAVPKWHSGGASGGDPLALPPTEVMTERIRISLELWRRALPAPFHLLAARYGYTWEELDVRVAVSGNMADFSLWVAAPSGDSARSSESTRMLWHYAVACATHPAWPWRFIQTVLINVFEDFLKTLMGNPDVPSLRAEWQHDLACSLVPGGFAAPLIDGPRVWAAKVKSEAVRLLEVLDEHRGDFIEVGGRRGYDREQLQALAGSSLEELASTIDGPYPTSDMPLVDLEGWSGYSPDQLARRISEVYRSALQAYDEIVSEFFPDLRPVLSLDGLRPVELTGQVRVVSRRAHVRYTTLPLPAGSENLVRISPAREGVEFDGYSDEFLDEFRQRRRAYRPSLPSWTMTTFADGSSFSPLDRMPATKRVVQWIWRDLKQIHLTDRMAPH
ncbi:hypothetical protein [Micromonospora sp. DH14]|uniref:hypothetical protein n=1 Tax=Micromonospora sp. DH14 TaxID=3040120 RepID=UPI002442AD2C|nr:hypothetical protein [Micromonospora sp. DH14]MDG9678331.1 hypothetical protein [Micromonospora sp. DH14]